MHPSRRSVTRDQDHAVRKLPALGVTPGTRESSSREERLAWALQPAGGGAGE